MKKILYLVTFTVVLLTSCSNKETATSLGTNPTDTSVYLTDAPGMRPNSFRQDPWQGYIYVNLDVVGIQYYAKDSLKKDSTWKASNLKETIVDVAALSNGDSTLLTMISIPTGEKIHKIKFLLGANNTVVLSDSTLKKLNIREHSDSSIVVHVIENSIALKYDIMLNFDIAHSIIIGPPGNFYLAPVMRGFIMQESAHISGFVFPKKLATKVFVV